jgi:hypothetical protein
MGHVAFDSLWQSSSLVIADLLPNALYAMEHTPSPPATQQRAARDSLPVLQRVPIDELRPGDELRSAVLQRRSVKLGAKSRLVVSVFAGGSTLVLGYDCQTPGAL